MGEDVGILSMEIYFPTQFVDQVELEKYDNVSAGKYTKGLGQLKMGFCADCEDAISMALTVTKRLLAKNNLSPAQVGRLEVGTESGVDRSKSVKSYLMQLFQGNHDIGGLDTVQACFGGTQALFNAVDWLTSAAWDGRLAVVVASDVAAYPPGPARPTGGAGAVAMLLGPNAPLVMEPRLRSHYSAHVYDFYKPNPFSEYPVVDGALSINCYLTASKTCYEGIVQKVENLVNERTFGLKDVVGVLFHSPYSRLVEKAFSGLVMADVKRGTACSSGALTPEEVSAVRKTKDAAVVNGDSHHHSSANGDTTEQTKVCQPSPELLAASHRLFLEKTFPALWLAREIGNMYTPSLYACLVSFLVNYFEKPAPTTPEPRILMFSYGSGLASAMFSIKLKTSSPHFVSLCKELTADVRNKLSRRHCTSPAKLVGALEKRHVNFGKVPQAFSPALELAENLIEGDSFALEKIDDLFRRSYVYIPPTVTKITSPSSPPPSQLPLAAKHASLSDDPKQLNNTGEMLLGNGIIPFVVDPSSLKNGYQHAD